jgi:hypothetical protein
MQKLLIPADFRPSVALDLANLGAIESENWSAELAAIEGLVNASFIGAEGVSKLLVTGWPVEHYVVLNTANPGEKGELNIFGGTGNYKAMHWGALSERHRVNDFGVEWTEVAEKNSVEFFSLFLSIEASKVKFSTFLGYGSLTTKVEFEKGDSLRFNVGALKIEVP